MGSRRQSIKTDENTGFGFNRSLYGKRFLTSDGRSNVKQTGLPVWQRLSWYHTLIEMKSGTFLAVIFSSFVAINILFAAIYLAIGIDHLSGIDPKNELEKVSDAFFFSTQTFTTVGYGRINPTGYLTSFIASFQAFSGLLFFAVATGLFYARFSRARAFIRFSSKAIIAPYREGSALMVRLAPYKNNSLTDAEVKLILAMARQEGGTEVNKFYALPLERSRIDLLSSTWTIVHPIDENSPLTDMTVEEIRATEMEVMVYLKAFDDTFSNTVVARASYMFEQIIVGAKFRSMLGQPSAKGQTIVDISKIDDFDIVPIKLPTIQKTSY